MSAHRRGAVQMGAAALVAVLRALVALGLVRVANRIMSVLSALGASETRMRSLRSRVHGRQDPPCLRETVIVFADEAARPARNNAAVLDRLAAFDTLSLVIEPGATIPDWAGSERLAHTQFVVHAFADTRPAMGRLGLDGRARPALLRDQFNDMSPQGEALFLSANQSAKAVMQRLLPLLPLSGAPPGPRMAHALETALAAGFGSQLSLLECMLEAMRTAEGGAVVLCVRSSDFVLPGWARMVEAVPRARLAVSHAAPDRSASRRFAQRLAARDSSLRDSLLREGEIAEAAQGAVFAPPGWHARWRAFDSAMGEAAQRWGDGLVAPAQARGRTGTTALVVHGGAAPAYQATLGELADALRASDNAFGRTVFLHASASPETDVLPERISRPAMQALDLGALSDACAPYGAGTHGLGRLAETLLGGNANSPLAAPLTLFLRDTLPWIVLAHRAGGAIARAVQPDVVIASTSRHVLARAVCAGMMDAAPGLAVLDVQTLNVLDHPKYATPTASHLAVIDAEAKALHARAFGFDPDHIVCVGAPPDDALRRAVAATNRADARRRLGLAPDGPVVTLISQLQPMGTMRRICAPLAQMTAADALQLLIRLHPREGDGREAVYRELLRAHGVDGAVFSRSDAAATVLAASDVCVTLYSNMARQAVLVGVPVVAAEFDGFDRPLSLSEVGLAQGACSPDALRSLVRQGLEDAATGRSPVAAAYLQANPHLRHPAAPQLVALAEALAVSARGASH